MILSDYSIRFRVAVFVLTAVIAVLGVISYVTLPREGMPDVTIPYVFVTAVYDGMGPADIERLVTIPLEKQIANADGIKEVRSTSSENLCFISVKFVAGQNIDQAKQRVKDKVDLAKPDLPGDLDAPVVEALNISSDIPVFLFALWGDADSDRLRQLAEDLQDQIEMVPGVKKATLAGAPEREIRVEMDLQRMTAYKVPIGLVMQRIAQENTTSSAGNMEVAGNKIQIRIPGEFKLASEIGQILIVNRNGRPVYMSDICRVSDTYKDVETVSRVNGKPCISIGVKKRVGENSVGLIRRVKAVIDRFSLPPEVAVTVVYDESRHIDMMVNELENNVFSGSLLVVVTLFLFMGWRNSLFVAVAIPLSMFMAFTAMGVIGQSMNMIVLFSLVLATGMLVDNGVVIVENTYRHRNLGLTRDAAARQGAGEVAWPVITSTLTTVLAFVPLLYWPDMMGQFMGFLPRTLILTLLASLFVALVINPAICSVFIKGRTSQGLSPQGTPVNAFMKGYERFLRAALRHRGPALLIAALTLVASWQLYARMNLGMELFPEVEPRNATIKVKYPQGTSLDKVGGVLQDIEKKLAGFEDVQFFLSTAGQGGGFSFGGGAGGSHMGNIHVEFVEMADRKVSSMKLVAEIRDGIGRIPGADVRVEREEGGPPTGDPVSVELAGEDFDVLSEYAGRIRRAIETVPGLVDLDDDLDEALPEIQFHVDRQRAAMLGLDTGTIGIFLRTSIFGMESSKFRADENEYDITLRLPVEQRSQVTLLHEIMVPLMDGRVVPLSSVGSVEYVGGRGSINRKDQKRTVTLSGFDQGRGVDEIVKEVGERVGGLGLPPGYRVAYAGDTKEMQESMAFLLKAFLVALGLILVILVLQFNSVLVPVIILASIGLSIVGVLWGLLIWHMKFGVIMTGLGVISLAGIVVNNSIVLMACIQERQAEGLDIVEAVVTAGRMRIRPVLLTAATTVLGLIPMIAGWSLDIHQWPPRLTAGSESSTWWAPMAVAVAVGLAVATVLTLVLVPLMYTMVYGVKTWMEKRWRAALD